MGRLILNLMNALSKGRGTPAMATVLRAGKCAVCGKDKPNLSDHHALNLDGKRTGVVLVICRDCHNTLEQYRQALGRVKREFPGP